MTFDQWWGNNEKQYSADACHMSEYHMASVVWEAAKKDGTIRDYDERFVNAVLSSRFSDGR